MKDESVVSDDDAVNAIFEGNDFSILKTLPSVSEEARHVGPLTKMDRAILAQILLLNKEFNAVEKEITESVKSSLELISSKEMLFAEMENLEEHMPPELVARLGMLDRRIRSLVERLKIRIEMRYPEVLDKKYIYSSEEIFLDSERERRREMEKVIMEAMSAGAFRTLFGGHSMKVPEGCIELHNDMTVEELVDKGIDKEFIAFLKMRFPKKFRDEENEGESKKADKAE